MEILAAAGVKRALVSSTPDDGTLKLYQADSNRIVPALRPYRTREDMSGWARSQEVFEYVSKRIRRGIYKGIGEFHLFDARDAGSPQMKGLVRIAVERDIVLQVHSDSGPVGALFAHDPKLKILWAHAGMSESPNVIQELLDKYKNLWAGVSFREGDIAPGGKLDPRWRALFVRHQDRFVYGTDTYISERWSSYGDLVKEHRTWLKQLPRMVAEKIAYRNAVRLFGAGKATGLSE
jgi:predicted TIM-barrel fold metal-dependent hydrolase